ncbi:MAG: response regulator [Alphaproteobacteria bacterium]
MADTPLIAVVEDDAEIRTLVRDYLTREGFAVRACEDGASFDALLAETPVDLVILDLMMPGEDGLSICRRISPHMPVIILSAKGDDIDRIVGLEVGSDDYLAKPFNPRELCARVRAVLRRRGAGGCEGAEETPAPGGEIYRFENWRLDAEGRSLIDPKGTPVALSGGEFALLLAFARHPRRTVTRDQLLDWTRGNDAAPVDRAIDVQLSRLRRKLGDDPRAPHLIKTVRGDGYIFAAEVVQEKRR